MRGIRERIKFHHHDLLLSYASTSRPPPNNNLPLRPSGRMCPDFTQPPLPVPANTGRVAAATSKKCRGFLLACSCGNAGRHRPTLTVVCCGLVFANIFCEQSVATYQVFRISSTVRIQKLTFSQSLVMVKLNLADFENLRRARRRGWLAGEGPRRRGLFRERHAQDGASLLLGRRACAARPCGVCASVCAAAAVPPPIHVSGAQAGAQASRLAGMEEVEARGQRVLLSVRHARCGASLPLGRCACAAGPCGVGKTVCAAATMPLPQ